MEPNGPKGFFGLPVVQAFRKNPLGFLEKLHREYGDFVYARMGPFRAYFLFHPDDIKEVLVNRVRQQQKMERQRAILRQWDGNGLLLSEGDFWLRQRRLVQPAFQARRFESYGKIITERTERVAAAWAKSGRGDIVDAEAAMTRLTLEITAQMLFGAEVAEETPRLAEAVETLSGIAVKEMAAIAPVPSWIPTAHNRKKRWATGVLDETIRRFIRERRASKEDRGDLLSMLLLAVEEGASMTDEQARDEAMVLFLAAHDTTAAALAWTWYLLARHEAVQEKAAAEIRAVTGGAPVANAHVPSLKYLTQVIKESLRLYPPAVGVFAREVTEPFSLRGHGLGKGDLIYLFSYVTHRDERWFPDPLRFDPERFLPEREKALPPFAYFPFGGGMRVCVGQALAMTEMSLVLASLLSRFRVRLAPGQGEPAFEVLLSLRPKGGVRLTLEPRGA